MLSSRKGRTNALFKHNTVSICITIRLHALIFYLFFDFSTSQPLRAPDSGQAAAEPFCSRTHFHVILTCQCAQNCQTLLKALDAMCNSFNTRPRRYPYHCCNGVLMPPCILRACTGQLVIRLIYSTRPELCWRLEYMTGHSAAFVLQRWSQGHTWFYHKPEKHHSWLPICSQTLCFHEGKMWEHMKWRFMKSYRADVSQLINS